MLRTKPKTVTHYFKELGIQFNRKEAKKSEKLRIYCNLTLQYIKQYEKIKYNKSSRSDKKKRKE